MPFIFTNGNGKAEPAKRKLIRRFVMLGKNRGKTRNPKRVETAISSTSENPGDDREIAAGLSINMHYSGVPNKVGSEFSFTQFAAAVEPTLIHDIMKCTPLLPGSFLSARD